MFKEYARGRVTKQQLLQQATGWGLTNRRGKPLSSQDIGMLLRNRLYVGVVDVPDYGVRDKRGDFEPLINEKTFYRVQAVLARRVRSRAHWKLGEGSQRLRHVREVPGGCHRVNVPKTTIDGLFVALRACHQ